MIATFLVGSLIAAQVMIGLAMIFATYRIIKGPRAQDRVIGMDTLYASSMLLMLVNGMRTGTVFYFEAAFVIALLGFVTTVALAKFLLRGEVIE